MPDERAADPADDSPFIVEPLTNLVRIHLAGITLAESRSAVAVRQASGEAAIYLPLADVDATMIERSEKTEATEMGERIFYHLPHAGADPRTRPGVTDAPSPRCPR